MLLVYLIPGSKSVIRCEAHEGCPILKGGPPTVKTCVNHLSIPNWLLKKHKGDRKKAAEEYLGWMLEPAKVGI